MKDSNSVEITSLVPDFTFSTAATPPHNAPAITAASVGRMKASPSGRPLTWPYSATAVAAMPPTAICPSPPTLVRLARLASTKPKPTSANTVLRLSDAASAKGEPKAPSTNAAIAFGTETPIIAISSNPTPAANATASTGTSSAGRSENRGTAESKRPWFTAVIAAAPPSWRRSPPCARGRPGMIP